MTSGIPLEGVHDLIHPNKNVHIFFHEANLVLLDCTFYGNIGTSMFGKHHADDGEDT